MYSINKKQTIFDKPWFDVFIEELSEISESNRLTNDIDIPYTGFTYDGPYVDRLINEIKANYYTVNAQGKKSYNHEQFADKFLPGYLPLNGTVMADIKETVKRTIKMWREFFDTMSDEEIIHAMNRHGFNVNDYDMINLRVDVEQTLTNNVLCYDTIMDLICYNTYNKYYDDPRFH